MQSAECSCGVRCALTSATPCFGNQAKPAWEQHVLRNSTYPCSANTAASTWWTRSTPRMGGSKLHQAESLSTSPVQNCSQQNQHQSFPHYPPSPDNFRGGRRGRLRRLPHLAGVSKTSSLVSSSSSSSSSVASTQIQGLRRRHQKASSVGTATVCEVRLPN